MDNQQRIFDKNNDRYKILVDYLAIRVNIVDNMPYYTIIYHPINSENKYEGYGSYSLSIVHKWIGEYFILKER